MGLVYVKFEVSNPATLEMNEAITMLVGTGATLSVLPALLLDRLGVGGEGTRAFSGSGGDPARDTGIVRFTYEEVTGGVSAVFGMEGDLVLLGVTALGVLGYQVDPVHHRLVRADILLL